MTVLPSRFPTFLTSQRSARAQPQRRLGPIGPSKTDSGQITLCPTRASPYSTAAVWRVRRRGPLTARARTCPASRGLRIMSPRADAARWRGEGSGCGSHEAAGRTAGGVPVQKHSQDVDSRDAVDHGVVGLVDHGPAATLKAVDQPAFPWRPGQVQGLRHEAGDPVPQGLLGAGAGQGGVPDVTVDAKSRVVDPDGAPQLQWHLLHPLPIPGDQVEPALDGGRELGLRRRGTLEYQG